MTDAIAGRFTGTKVADDTLQMPKCLRRRTLEPSTRIRPRISGVFLRPFVLGTLCSRGVRVDPVGALFAPEAGAGATPGAAAHGRGIATSFPGLQLLVGSGHSVVVTDTSGTQTAGRIQDLTPSSLSLLVDGTPRDFMERDVTEVRERRHDSLANGARWGFGVGAALGILAVASCTECDWGSHPGLAATAVGLYGAMGTGIGVGIDALFTAERTVYRRPAVGVSFRF
jgi:hypothetical protein